ncbi:hypothetical protein BD410DRAFT_808940 [Rickenella mellea]|uniref:Uncharacterized protein n=1 Tax=Rickenella mellea TaxID=50990 RepID=A0A4Y7PKQ8_9AGAM|nr:hypothetical protein BD410DRAFT_808940 [Rickenella mellea]
MKKTGWKSVLAHGPGVTPHRGVILFPTSICDVGQVYFPSSTGASLGPWKLDRMKLKIALDIDEAKHRAKEEESRYGFSWDGGGQGWFQRCWNCWDCVIQARNKAMADLDVQGAADEARAGTLKLSDYLQRTSGQP